MTHPSPANQTDPAGFFLQYPDTLLGGNFEWLLVGVVFTIVLVGSLRFGFDRAFAVSSFTGLLLSTVLLMLNVAGTGIVFLFALMTVLAALLNRREGPV